MAAGSVVIAVDAMAVAVTTAAVTTAVIAKTVVVALSVTTSHVPVAASAGAKAGDLADPTDQVDPLTTPN